MPECPVVRVKGAGSYRTAMSPSKTACRVFVPPDSHREVLRSGLLPQQSIVGVSPILTHRSQRFNSRGFGRKSNMKKRSADRF